MNKAAKVLLAAALEVTMSGAAMASHVCAYVNDNDASGSNSVEGYKVGPGTATAHVGPYSTNGQGTGGGSYTGGLGAARVREGDLYVDDAGSVPVNITHFTINKTDCTLTLDTTLYPDGATSSANGDSLTITPNGRTLFVGPTGDDHIYSHTIAANGSLGSPFTEASTPDIPTGIEVSPDGKTLVVSYYDILQVCAYPISGGHLGTPNCQSTAGMPAGISIDPASKCVYVGEAYYFNKSEVAAFTLTGGVLGAPIDYSPFGPGQGSEGILVNWDNKEIYVSNQRSAQMTTGSVASGCKLTYQTIISDGISIIDAPGQIAQGKRAHGYVVNGSIDLDGTPSMGIFTVSANGSLTPIGSGQFPLMMSLAVPLTIVVVD